MGRLNFKAQIIASVTQVLAEAAVMTGQKPDTLDTTQKVVFTSRRMEAWDQGADTPSEWEGPTFCHRW